MTARILVVDDVVANVRVLEAKLTIEYYDVLTCSDGPTALEIAARDQPDIILLDVMMPGMDGFETCRHFKNNPVTRHIPVIMVTALDEREDRIKGLEAGADDFLTKPLDDVALFARVRSLLRLKQLTDELRVRERSLDTEGEPVLDVEVPSGAHIAVVAVDDRTAARLAAKLPDDVAAQSFGDPRDAIQAIGAGVDLVVVDLTSKHFDGLRVCARVRSDAATRNTPILAVVDPDARDQMVRALDLGVNDVVTRPVDAGELAARIRTQLRRARYADKLRDRLDESLELAVTDPLTGLFNRRYLASRLDQAAEGFARVGEPLSVILFDLDQFKEVNDRHGHAAGDFVLKAFADTLKSQLRAIDIAGRFGGEEFLVILKDTAADCAADAAERVRAAVARQDFSVKATGDTLNVTVSAGVAQMRDGETVGQLLDRTDAALYDAKNGGRNQIVLSRAKAA